MIIYGIYRKFVDTYASPAEGWELIQLFLSEEKASERSKSLHLTQEQHWEYKVEEVFVNE